MCRISSLIGLGRFTGRIRPIRQLPYSRNTPGASQTVQRSHITTPACSPWPSLGTSKVQLMKAFALSKEPDKLKLRALDQPELEKIWIESPHQWLRSHSIPQSLCFGGRNAI